MTPKQTAEKALDMLHRLKNLCYSEDSNNTFDLLHDDIYWQCAGLVDSMDECETEEDWQRSSKEFNQALDMAKKIKAYHKAVTMEEDIDWMYA